MKPVFLCLPLLLCGCIANNSLFTDSVAEVNVSNVSRLSLGMKQAEVIRIMRAPYNQQTFEMDEAIFDVWFYVTNPTVLGQTRMVPMNLTPLAFKNGKLIGWGYSYYNYLSRRQQAASQVKREPFLPLEKTIEPKEDINLEKALQPNTRQQQPAPKSQEKPNWGPVESPKQQSLPQGKSQKPQPSQPAQPSTQPSPPTKQPVQQPPSTQQPKPPQSTKQQQTAPQSQEGQNWGPIESTDPQQHHQPPTDPVKPPLSMSRKPQKPDQINPPDSKSKDGNEKKKAPLNEEDYEMLEKESEQNFNQN